MDVVLAAPDLAERLFPELDLGDVRRDRRFKAVVDAMARSPGVSLPHLFPNPTQYHAALALFHGTTCTHEAILSAHAAAVLTALEATNDVVLFLHDATHLDFSGHTTLADDLGPIGNGGGRGWVAHQTIAVDPATRVVHGLVSQILHVRAESTREETVAARRLRASRESRLWEAGIDQLGPRPDAAAWIDVADRGADTFEFLQALRTKNRRFVIRSTHNRALGEEPSGSPTKDHLHDRLRRLEPHTRWALELPARTGVAARRASLCGAAEPVTLRPPHVRKGDFRREPVAVWAVRVWEPDPPTGTEPLEWILLTSEPVEGPGKLERVAGWYACRWMIEEFHKVQKSGMGIERYQLQSVEALRPLVALVSVMAVALLNLRQAIRTPVLCDRPAAEVVPSWWVEVLRRIQGGPAGEWTVMQFAVALARRGGYLKNPNKHPPGWITLWRGWSELQVILRILPSIPEIT
jgi:hypothetical protein